MFEEISNFIDLDKKLFRGAQIDACHLNDAKTRCSWTQHSQCSRKHTPYSLCSCARGEAVRCLDDVNWICRMLMNEEHERLYAKSEKVWDKKQERIQKKK